LFVLDPGWPQEAIDAFRAAATPDNAVLAHSLRISHWIGWLAVFVSMGALVRLGATFPTAVQPHQLRGARLGALRRWGLNPGWVWLVIAVAFFWNLGASLLPAVPIDIRWRTIRRIRDVSSLVLYFLLPLAATLLAVSYMRANYRTAGEESRRRILWVLLTLESAAILSLASLLLYGLHRMTVSSWPLTVGLALSMILVAVVPVGFIYAIFAEEAIDPRLAIRGTTIYSVLGACALFLFAGVQNLMEDALAETLSMPGNAAPWIAAGVIALAVVLLRSAIVSAYERVVDWLTPSESQEAEGLSTDNI
jgi:hypothetical protein